MMIGPTIILDKSAFQSFSEIELVSFRRYFSQVLTPILVSELLGDLTKHSKKGKKPEEKVVELANKFGGSGPPVTMNYMNACAANLLGYKITMDGRPIIDYAKEVRAPDGSRGAFIDLHPFNDALLRWQQGNFTDFDKLISELWRQTKTNLSVIAFKEELNTRYIIVPRANSVEEINTIAEDLLNKLGLQEVLLDWIMGQLLLSSELSGQIKLRWELSNTPIYHFAPYVYHCLRVMLCLHIAIRSNLIKWDSGHIFDLQYLYYLPFCMAFCSNDKIHQILAPLLIRENQSFVAGFELKTDLKCISELWNSFSESQRKKYSSTLGFYPFPRQDSIVFKLWYKHLGPWKPPRIESSDLTDEQSKIVLNEFERTYEEMKNL